MRVVPVPGPCAGEIEEEEDEVFDSSDDDGSSSKEGVVLDDLDDSESDGDEDSDSIERQRLLLAASVLNPSAAAAASHASVEAEAAADAAADRRTALISLAVAVAALSSYQAPGARLSALAFLFLSLGSFLLASKQRAARWYRGRGRLATAVGFRLSFAALAQILVASGRGTRGGGGGGAASASDAPSRSSALSFWFSRMAPAMIPFFTFSARLGGHPRVLAGMLLAYLAAVAALQPAACFGIEACWPRGREHFVAAAEALNRVVALATGSVATSASGGGSSSGTSGGSSSSLPRGSDAASSSSSSSCSSSASASSSSLSAFSLIGERACFDVMTFLFVSSAAASFVLERMLHHRSSGKGRGSGGKGGRGGRGRGRGGKVGRGIGGSGGSPSLSPPSSVVSPSPWSPPSSSSSYKSPPFTLLRIEAATTALAAVLLAMLLTWIALAVAGEVARSGATAAEKGGAGAKKPWLTELLERLGQRPCAPAELT